MSNLQATQPERADSPAPVPASDDPPTPPRVASPLSAGYLLLLGGLVVVATVHDLVSDDAYRIVAGLTRETWRAQDAITLLLVPVLLWSGRRARSGSLRGHLLCTAICLWLAYCYAHLAIGAPLNRVFLVYLAVLALAAFAVLDGIVRLDVPAVAPAFAGAPVRAAAWFLAIGGVGIGALWLSEIVAAWPGGLPPNIHLSELPNPTWVLDLAWILPMCVGAAVLLWRRHPAGPVLAALMLVFLLILSASMLLVTPFALAAELQSDPQVRTQIIAFSILFTVLAVVEGWLLAIGHQRLLPVGSWLRGGWWPPGRMNGS